jgi:hypothetical protein
MRQKSDLNKFCQLVKLGALAFGTIFLWSLIKLRKRILNYTTLTNLCSYNTFSFFFMLLTMLFKFAQKNHFPFIFLIGHFVR